MKPVYFGSVLRDRLRGILRRLKLFLRKRPNKEELVELAGAITDYAQMTQSLEGWRGQPPRYIIVGIQELAFRFRETPRTVKDALLVLNLDDIASPLRRQQQYWKISLSEIPSKQGNQTAA